MSSQLRLPSTAAKVLMSTRRPKTWGELVLYCYERKAHSRAGLELDQHVHVAVGLEVVTQHRSVQGKSANMVALTVDSVIPSIGISTVGFKSVPR